MIGLGTRVVVVDVVVDAVEDAAEEVFEAVVVVGDSTPNSVGGRGGYSSYQSGGHGYGGQRFGSDYGGRGGYTPYPAGGRGRGFGRGRGAFVFDGGNGPGGYHPFQRSGWGRGAGAGGPNFYEGPGRAADPTWPQKKGQSTQIHGWNQTVQGSGSGSISGPVNKDSKGGTQPSATRGTMNADPIQYFLGFFKGHLSDDEGR
ncbi:hypothetical protein ACKRZS_009627 [Fusarium odoratissimum]